MFELDIRLFNLVYTQCATLGRAFGFGAFEGFILYSGMITWGINSAINTMKVKK